MQIRTATWQVDSVTIHSASFVAGLEFRGRCDDSEDLSFTAHDDRPGEGGAKLFIDGKEVNLADLIDWFRRSRNVHAEVDVAIDRYGLVVAARFTGDAPDARADQYNP